MSEIPSDSQMLDWIERQAKKEEGLGVESAHIYNDFTWKVGEGPRACEHSSFMDKYDTLGSGKTLRDAIAQAIRDEEKR